MAQETSSLYHVSNTYTYGIIKNCCGHRVSPEGKSSVYSIVGGHSSRFAGEFSLAMYDLKMDPLETPREALQMEDQQKCRTLGERRIKTQGSMIEFTEMKRKAIRSRR